jgi:hypothetical protein
MMMDRAAFAMAGMSPAGQAATQPAGPMAGNWCMVPRCEIKAEKCTGGLKLHCHCEDDVATGTLQNLCKMLAGSMCSCCCTLNGICLCQCNLACGICTCESTEDGCCITCVSGDKACAKMLQACCDAISCCIEQGCCCYICFGNTPICCGCQA